PFARAIPGLLGTVIAIALRVGAHVFAIARAEQRRANGRAVPPGEDLGEDTHGARVTSDWPVDASARCPALCPSPPRLHHSTSAPGPMPSSAARPAFSSSTAAAGPSETTASVE